MKISTGEYIIRETMVSLKRNNWMSFASIGTVAVSLFVLGMFLILVMNMNRMTNALESQVEISVYAKDEVNDSGLRTLEERISALQGVESVKFIDREKAMERFRVRTAAEAIMELPGVETAKYGQDVVEHLFDITRLVRLFGLALMFVLALATLFIISNTIRLTVFARRKEVAIMKYVGATDWFIRWPFLLEGVVLGCLGGIVAALTLRGVYRIIAAKIYDTLAFFPLIPENPFLHYVTAAILLCGMLIGALGSTISLKRFLNA